jgi:hypothetical protein
MKIKNTPSTNFYRDMYNEIDMLLKEFKVFNGVKISINNIVGNKEFIQPNDVEIGYISYKLNKNKNHVNYIITLAELCSIEFGNSDWAKLNQLRYSSYLSGLEISLTPEVLTLLTILHELGHVEFWENYLELTNIEGSLLPIQIYHKYMSSIYEMVMKPWEYVMASDLNMNHMMFNSIEGYPEIFALRHFPRFIKLLRRYNLCNE